MTPSQASESRSAPSLASRSGSENVTTALRSMYRFESLGRPKTMPYEHVRCVRIMRTLGLVCYPLVISQIRPSYQIRLFTIQIRLFTIGEHLFRPRVKKVAEEILRTSALANLASRSSKVQICPALN